MNNDFISKELALWLKERGCEIEPEEWYIPQEKTGAVIRDKHPYFKDKCLPAYSWYSILVTHAKGFWGEDCTFETEQLLLYLRNSDTKEAEEYVRENSLFANSNLTE